MASSPQKNLQFISPPKEAGDFLQNQVKSRIESLYIDNHDREVCTGTETVDIGQILRGINKEAGFQKKSKIIPSVQFDR